MLLSKPSTLLFAAVAASTVTLALPHNLQSRALTPSTHCGDYDYTILSGTPWIVYNMLYNAAVTVGTQCTSYTSQTVSSSGQKEVIWSSTTTIDYVKSTNNIPKGYSFVGLTENLMTQLSEISEIPAIYSWKRTTTATTNGFKGNICFDFMTSDTKGDTTSSKAKEHMIWLQYEGGQLPIGWTDGPAATINDLYGTSWKLYEGLNKDTGITVSTLMPDVQFNGVFGGDIKDWLNALESLGRFTNATYVNVGNAGTEMFYGESVLEATLGLQINLS